MSARSYDPDSNPDRYTKINKPNVFRDDQMYVEVMSSDLTRKGICKYLSDSTPSDMTPIGRSKNMPIVVVLGDTASMGHTKLETVREFYLDGVLRAASVTEALVVDSGLVSSPGVAPPKLQHEDFCRNTFQMGIVPTKVKETLSLYHTQMLCLTDFLGWKDRPDEFAQVKFDFIRRLAGKGRIVCVLFNEGHNALEEAYAATRAGIGVIAVKGSGPLADEIANAKESGTSNDPKIMEMINSTCLQTFDMEQGRICDFAALIRMYATTDIVEMMRVCAKLEPLEVDQVWFDRGAPQLQLRVREGQGRLQFLNSGKTGTSSSSSSSSSKKKNKNKSKNDTNQKNPLKNNKQQPQKPTKSNKNNNQSSPTQRRKKVPSREPTPEPTPEPTTQYNDDQAQAAIKIQALQRGKIERAEVKQINETREKAAIKIQARARGKQGAKRAQRKKEGKPLDTIREEEEFAKVELNFDEPIVSRYRKDGFWVEIMHVSDDTKGKLFIRIKLHGIGTFCALPKACILKQGKNKQTNMKMISIKSISKKKAKHDDNGEDKDKIVITAIVCFIIKPNEKKLDNLTFKLQAGYDEVPIPNKFMRSFAMFRSAGPLSKAEKSETKDVPVKKKDEEKKTDETANKSEGTEEEIKAAIKMEAIARGNHDRKMVAEMKAEKQKLLKKGMTEDQAALKLEAMARGNRDREKVRRMKEEKKIAEKHGTMSEEDAAIKIEARMRGKQDRAKVAKMKEEKAKEGAKAKEEEEKKNEEKKNEEKKNEEKKKEEK